MSGPGPLGAIVDGGALVEVVWTSLAAGIGVTAAFAIAILGATRAVDLSRDGRPGAAAAYGALTAAALAGVAAAITYGIAVMVDK